ncbi:MAG: photosynthetic protein synthase I [SAR324 cluster bacterium]|uniref:Photosynthetic protein synthase I n=1 Tax=SAR324 cluster bacterium TaxID=2024889 RepID=A0A2A4T637_9DELT|nr:MAG: photosynthetic protein synthase I [SAR324 cluster bacterium]
MKYDAKKAAIGKRLFFDPRLSGNATISCSSCHNPEKGFADGMALSDAYTGTLGFRNTPTLINTAQKKKYGIPWFHDGRLGTNLNDVTRDQITETIWMNMDMRLMQERVKQDPQYIKMFMEAGLGEPSNGTVRKLIPEYLKSLQSKNVPFDQGTLSDAAKRGQFLFTGKANCVSCHTGALFADGKAHNLGVAENQEIFEDEERSTMFLAFNMFMGNENFMNLRRDPGAHVVSHKADGSDMGKFMTPTLRELKQTAPYMHNGTLATLDDVVEFYNQGGGKDVNKDPRIKPLGLSDMEKKDLVAFLGSLSGDALTGSDYVYTFADGETAYPTITNWKEVDNRKVDTWKFDK